MKRLTFTFVLLIVVGMLLGQWSTDPTINTTISDLAGDQAVPKIAVASNGDYYFGWFSNATGNYNVRLQRLDSQGNIMWEENGIIVSDNEAMTWLTEWDMTVDNEDNAILTFQDIRTGFNNAFVYKIDPEGNQLWGEDGVQLSDNEAFDAAPKVCVTSENNVIVAWAAEDIIRFNKVASDGSLPWGSEGFTISGENTYSWPQLLAVENDNFIMKYFEDSGPYWSPDRYVYAQKYDSDGNEVWDEVTTIVDEGGITAWNQVFSMVKDDQNGFYIAWHEDRYGTMDAHVFAQHIGSDGSILFQEDGVELAISSNRERYSPKIIWHEASEDIFVYWTEMDSDQNSAGIYGQRLNSVGEVLWGDNGIQIEPLQQPRFTLADAVAGADGALLFADIEASNNILKACLLDDQGAFVWTDGFKDLSTAATSKTHAVMCEESMDQWVMCWGSDDGTIMAQNISVNGELGPVEQISGISGLISLNGGGGSLAEVIITAGTTSTNADASGTYFLQLDPGVYTVTAQLEDYETAEQTVTVVEGIVEEGIDFSLDPAYYPPANVSIDSDAGILYWDDPQLVRDITGYQVYLDESSVGQIDAEITEFSFIGLINGTEYTAGVAAMYGDYLSEIVTVNFTYEGTGSEDFIPSITTLHGNYPNPFNPSTDIRFSLGRDTEVLLDVYNIKGEKVRTLVDGHLQVNDYSIQWNGKDDSGDIVGSGVYFYKLKTEKYTSTRKMILMK